MNTFLRFFYEFISIFFDGVEKIVKGFINGFVQMFNYGDYKQIVGHTHTYTPLTDLNFIAIDTMPNYYIVQELEDSKVINETIINNTK